MIVCDALHTRVRVTSTSQLVQQATSAQQTEIDDDVCMVVVVYVLYSSSA